MVVGTRRRREQLAGNGQEAGAGDEAISGANEREFWKGRDWMT